MKENFLERLSQEDKKRLGHIEGRPELFGTKVLTINSSSEAGDKGDAILVTTRDPGSANALLPVMKELVKDQRTHLSVITDGRAQEIIQNNFQATDVTPEGTVLGADAAIGTPNVILMDNSASEMGIDSYAAATFPEVPKVLVEDYYTSTIPFLSQLIERNLPLPEKICVMDEGAKEILVRRFSNLESRIEVTGQPAFDRFVQEDTEKIAREVKKKLGLLPDDKLVSFMAGIEEIEKIQRLAETLKDVADNFYFVFRRHPRDNTSYAVYEKIFTDNGIRVIDTQNFPTNDIGAASDVVLTTWSTEGLHGIYRRKPTAHIVDSAFHIDEGLELPLVPVHLGASVGIDHINELATFLPQLLDKQSPLNHSLQERMEACYPADGKNAERVAQVVRRYLPKK